MLQFTEHAFSANTERLLRALPLFDGINGTLYLDTALSTHKCYPNGGWQDYFELGSHAGDTAVYAEQWPWSSVFFVIKQIIMYPLGCCLQIAVDPCKLRAALHACMHASILLKSAS